LRGFDGKNQTRTLMTKNNRPPTAAAAKLAAASVPSSDLRGRLQRLLTNPLFERFIIGIIVLNALTLGLETSKTIMASYGDALHFIDHVLLGIFVIELLARMYAFRGAFWRDPWSLFDTAVVAIALVPASGEWSILRALRIVRALRLITAVPSIRRVVGSLMAAIPSMGSIVVLLLLINYVFAVMATKLFGADFADKFGTLGASFFTFFQIMTLEGWSGEVVRPVMEKHPWAWAFFVPYIILATFMVLNLFIGIIVDAIQNQNIIDKIEATPQTPGEKAMLAELQALRGEVEGMRRELQAGPRTGGSNSSSQSHKSGKRR
jgi:voltage-gated sodium channel